MHKSTANTGCLLAITVFILLSFDE